MSTKRQPNSNPNLGSLALDKYKKRMDTRVKSQVGVEPFADQASGKRYTVTGIVLKNEASKFIPKARSISVAILHGQAPADTLDVVASRDVPAFAFVLPTVKPKDDAPEMSSKSARPTELLTMSAPVAQMVGTGVLRVNAYPSPDGTSDPATTILPGMQVQVNGVKVVQNDRDPYRFHVNTGSKMIHLSEPSGFSPLESTWRKAGTEEKAWTASSFWWSVVAGGFFSDDKKVLENDDSYPEVEEQKGVFRDMWASLPAEFEKRLVAKSVVAKGMPGQWAEGASKMLVDMGERAKEILPKDLARGHMSAVEPLPQYNQGDDDVPYANATLHLGRLVDGGVPSVLQPVFLGCQENTPVAMSRIACGGVVAQISIKGKLLKLAIDMFFVGDTTKASAEIDAGNMPLVTNSESQVGVKLSARTVASQLGVKGHGKLHMVVHELLPYADITMTTGVAYKEPGVAGNLKSFFAQEICINVIDGLKKVAVLVSEEFVVKFLTNGTKVFAKNDDDACDEQIDFGPQGTPKFPLLSKDGYQAITEATCKIGDTMRLPENKGSPFVRKYGVVFREVATSVAGDFDITTNTQNGEAFLERKAQEMDLKIEDFLLDKCVVYCYV